MPLLVLDTPPHPFNPASATFAAYRVHTLWPKQQTVVAAPLKASPHHSHSQQPFVKIAYLHMTLTQARPSPLCRILYKTQLTGNTAECMVHHCRIARCLKSNHSRKSSIRRVCITCLNRGALFQAHLLQIMQGLHEHKYTTDAFMHRNHCEHKPAYLISPNQMQTTARSAAPALPSTHTDLYNLCSRRRQLLRQSFCHLPNH